MQLAIDIGNTRIKAGIFEQNVLKKTLVFDDTALFFQSQLVSKLGIKRAIVGSVVDGIDAFVSDLSQQANVMLFKADTPLPLVNKYQSAATLGSDRLAAAVGGNELAPNENILVIDAGTCVKYNFVNGKNEYIGGAISPGLKMRFTALNTFTARLPLLKADEKLNSYIGKTTEESIRSGVENGIVKELDGCIDEYRRDFNNLKVFLTGGDTDFFAKRLKNCIFADQNLILKGLNRILSHNE